MVADLPVTQGYAGSIPVSPAKPINGMEKKAKIIRTVFVSEWNNPQGGQVYYHEIELDNGDSGQIGSKEKMPAKLNPGSELTYTIESTSRGNKIKAVVVQTTQGFKRTAPEPRVQMISFTASYVKDLVIADKVKMDEFEKQFNRIYSLMISKL